MKEKIKQKGFIQIPLLVFIITSIIAASVGTGIILYKQGKLKLTADVSETIKEKEIQPTTEEMVPAEVSTIADIQPLLKMDNGSVSPEQTPTAGLESTEPPLAAQPAPEPTPVVSTPTPIPATTPSPEIQEIKAKVEQINEEQIRFNAEQIRQSRCIDLSSLKERIQKLCHSYYFVELDRCIEIRQKDVDNLTQYVADFDNPESDAYKLWKTAGGQDADYYRERVAEETDKVDQMIALKPQYESLKAECGQ